MIDGGAERRHVLRSSTESESHDLEREGDDEQPAPRSRSPRCTERSVSVVVRRVGIGESATYGVERQRHDHRNGHRCVRPWGEGPSTRCEPRVRRDGDTSDDHPTGGTRCHQLLGFAEEPLDECGRDHGRVGWRDDGVVVVRDGRLQADTLVPRGAGHGDGERTTRRRRARRR